MKHLINLKGGSERPVEKNGIVEIDPPKYDEQEDDIIDENDAQKAKGE